MSSIKYSPSQEKAIKTRGSNILVSAGAGSGKTTVLTQRISDLVAEGTKINRFLVLTFTEAAANEMKLRIRNEISKTQGEEGALLVDESHIETFDAFALWLVKKYSYVLGINGDISIIDSGVMAIAKSEAIREVIDEYLQNKEFLNIYTKYCYKNDNIIVNAIESILKLAARQLDKDDFFKTYIINTYDENFISLQINKANKLILDTLEDINSKISRINLDTLQSALYEFYGHFDAFTKFNDLRDIALLWKDYYPTLNGKGIKGKVEDEDRTLFNEIKEEYKKNIFVYFDYGSKEEIINEYLSHKEEAEIIFNMAKEVDTRLDQFKNKNGIYDFSDISMLANKLFKENPSVVKEVQNMFDYIFVDEYQDTNDIQEFVISKLGRKNVYMVGDIKQSIYRFRNADCEIFNSKFKNYKAGLSGTEIDLNNNFRSRPQVVEGVNDIFSNIMDRDVNPNSAIEYSQGHGFVYGDGQETYSHHEDENEYGFVFKEYDNADALEDEHEYEANLIADDIIDKVNKGFKIYDKKLDATRPVRFSDFAILIDASTHFDKIIRTFNSRNIPLSVKFDDSSINSVFARIIKNILKLVYFVSISQYDVNFRHAYLSISRSPVIKENDQELLKLKERDPEKLIELIKDDKLYKILLEIASQVKSLSLSEIMLLIYDKFNLTDTIFKLGSYEKNSLLWDKFVDNSIEMEKLGYHLKEYIEYFDNLDKLEEGIDIPPIDEVDNAVTLSTIHKAKGLEYHIVYLPYLSRDLFNKGNHSNPPIFASTKCGLIFPKVNVGISDSFMKLIDKNLEHSEEFNECMRLLYVAMTRCMDETILFLCRPTSECTYLPYARKYGHIFDNLERKGVVTFEKVVPTDIALNVSRPRFKSQPFKLVNFSYEYKEKAKQKASKELHINNPELLQLGTNVHYLMEHLDFETKDTSFIEDSRIRSDIDQIVSLPIFSNLKNDNIFHEYEFYDEENNVHGIIDCMIIRDDHIDLIDFKLKNIDDESYHHQLNTYKRYIEKVSNLPIHMYLLSIFDKILEEVEDENN